MAGSAAGQHAERGANGRLLLDPQSVHLIRPYLRRASVNRRTLYCCRVTVRCVPMDLDWRHAVSADGRPEASRMLLLTPPALPEHRRTTQLSAGSIWNWRSWSHGSLS